jgi:hypothetical protein
MSPAGPPFFGVVAQLKSSHSDPSGVKNIIDNFLHLGLFEAMCKGHDAIHMLNQIVKDKLGQRWMPNH